jgi:hypothetical protein
MLQFKRSTGSHQTLKVANIFFHFKCYNSLDLQVLIKPSKLLGFSSISNSTIKDLACSHRNLKFAEIFWEFQCNKFKRSAGYHKNLKVAKIFFKDPQDLVKTSKLGIFLLVSMLQFEDP